MAFSCKPLIKCNLPVLFTIKVYCYLFSTELIQEVKHRKWNMTMTSRLITLCQLDKQTKF